MNPPFNLSELLNAFRAINICPSRFERFQTLPSSENTLHIYTQIFVFDHPLLYDRLYAVLEEALIQEILLYGWNFTPSHIGILYERLLQLMEYACNHAKYKVPILFVSPDPYLLLQQHDAHSEKKYYEYLLPHCRQINILGSRGYGCYETDSIRLFYDLDYYVNPSGIVEYRLKYAFKICRPVFYYNPDLRSTIRELILKQETNLQQGICPAVKFGDQEILL